MIWHLKCFKMFNYILHIDFVHENLGVIKKLLHYLSFLFLACGNEFSNQYKH